MSGGRLFWLGFVFPCLGAAQDAGEAIDSAVSEPQVAIDEQAQNVSVEGEMDSPPSPVQGYVVEEAQPERPTAAERENSMVNAVPQRSSAQDPKAIGVQVPAPAPECYSEPPKQPSCCSPLAPPPVPCPPPAQTLCSKDRDCWPSPNGSITLEFLYFKAMMDNLRYGVKYPFQVLHPNYVIANIEQHFEYDPGGRINLGFTLDDFWELEVSWTYFNAHPGTTSAFSNQEIIPLMTSTALGGTGTSTANSLHGKWQMTMNVFNFDFKKPFCIGKTLMFAPILGVQGAIFRHVQNAEFGGVVPSTFGTPTPTKVGGTNKVWAVGPDVAIEARLLAKRRLDLYMRAAYSAMLGQFSGKTSLQDFLNPTGANLIIIRDASTRVFSMVQVQAAVSKRWEVGRGLIELDLGWETQFWQGINRWDYLSSTVQSTGGNLMLAGPFFRFSASF